MGSITLDRGGTSITLTNDLSIQRQVGRPEAELRARPGALPNYVDKNRSSSDIWIISGEFISNSAASDAKTLIESILRDPLGRGSLTLTFDSNLYGLDSYTVFPEGSRSGRVSYAAGRDGSGWVSVNTLELRVVDNS